MSFGENLRSWLPAGGFGQVLYVFDAVDSTNTTAAQLADEGSSEGTLVVADRQHRGRGRGGSRWVTAPASAIAMSLILRPTVEHQLRWAGLGAVAIAEGLEPEGLAARIKWPNDVLLGGRKVAGVLAEAAWDGDRLRYLVLGIGVNVGFDSAPVGGVAFPATTVEEHAGSGVDRHRLIAAVVGSLERWYARLGSPDFLDAWESRLAYRGQRVHIALADGDVEGRLLGLGRRGEARVLDDGGREVSCAGEARWLRPVDTLAE